MKATTKKAFEQALRDGKIEVNYGVRPFVGFDGTAEITRYRSVGSRGVRENIVIRNYYK